VDSDEDVVMEDDDAEDGLGISPELNYSVSRSTSSHASEPTCSEPSMAEGGPSRAHLQPQGAYRSMSSSSSSLGLWDIWRQTPSSTTPETSPFPSRNPELWYPAEASESRTFKIMYVPDPSRALKRANVECDLGWTSRNISPEHFEAIKDLPGLVYKCGTSRKGTVKVQIAEWVSVRIS